MLRTLRRLLGPMIAMTCLVALVASTGAPADASAHARTRAHTWIVQVGSQTASGSVQGMNYGPGTIRINRGDTVRWVAKSMEIHTVSFINRSHPAVPYSPTTAYMNVRTPQRSIKRPGQFRNSGIMDTMPARGEYRTYALRFTGTGTFHYICYVHGKAMVGTVVVRKRGTRYPHAQAQYNLQAWAAANAVISDGLNLWDRTLGSATSTHIYVGAADMRAMVMRFIGGNVSIHVGDSITFDMAKNMIPVPHTVTFGAEPANPAVVVGDPSSFAGGNLSSGVLLPPNFGPPGSSTFTVTFTKAGVYPYVCMFHDQMGMKGTITVLNNPPA